jgi:hypothetical protein
MRRLRSTPLTGESIGPPDRPPRERAMSEDGRHG